MLTWVPVDAITPEQYLELERKADFKSEYYAGGMFAMAGGKRLTTGWPPT